MKKYCWSSYSMYFFLLEKLTLVPVQMVSLLSGLFTVPTIPLLAYFLHMYVHYQG